MLEHRDQSNCQIVRNYVAMPDRVQFSAKEIAAATGVCIQTVRNIITSPAKQAVIKKTCKINGWIYYRKAHQDERLLAESKTKSVATIAKEKGVSKEAIYAKMRPYLPPKELRATRNQYDALKLISDGWQPNGYRETVKSLLKRGWVVEVSAFTYKITAKGQEVLNAKSGI